MRDLEAYQQDYTALPFEDTQARYRKRKILETLSRLRPRLLLEVGCGLDPIFNHYRDFDACTVIEPVKAFAQNARVQAKGLPVIVVPGMLEDEVDQLKASSYDFILLSSLLHEIADSRVLLATVAALCGPNTIVHVNVPNAASLHRLLAVAMGLIPSVYTPSITQQRMQQTHTFDIASLAQLVETNGFEVVEQGSFFIKPFTHAQMATLHSSGFISDAMLDGFYQLGEHFPGNGSEIFMNLRRRA